MSIAHVNVCSNSVECWPGRLTSRRLVIIMLGAYTQPCQSASTPLSRLQCVNAVVTHCTDVDTVLAEVGQCCRTKLKGRYCPCLEWSPPLHRQLSWQVLPGAPPSPNGDQLSGKKSARPVNRLNVATTVALIGLHYLPYRHIFDVNITPHVCEGLEAI